MLEIDFNEIQIPIGDEDLWGRPDSREIENAFHWPFGTLLANFYKLAKRNGIDWPLRSRDDWQGVVDYKEPTVMIPGSHFT